MPTLLKESGLQERVSQPSKLRVTRGGVEITLDMLNEGNDWKNLPGETEIFPVRIVNRISKNGTIYESPALRDIAKIHEDHYIATGHEDEYANPKYPEGFRPERTRFAKTRRARTIEEHGQIVAVDAAMVIDESQPQEANRYAVKALRDPKSVMLSIETMPPPAWDGYRDEDGILHVTEVKEMLDTATVTNGGTTTSLQENHSPKKRRRKMPNGPQKLAEANAEITRLKEHCKACEGDILAKDSKIKELEDQLAALQPELDELATLRAKVQESERREAIIKEAKDLGLTLQESKLNRLVKQDESDVSEELKELQGLKESKSSFTPEPTGEGSDTEEFTFDASASF